MFNKYKKVRPLICRESDAETAAVLANEWQNPLTENYEEIFIQALERESTGQKISYNDMRKILERGMDTSQSSYISPIILSFYFL